MGFIKWICKRVKCRSTCSYNQEAILDLSVLDHKLNDYELKLKDIITIRMQTFFNISKTLSYP